MRLITQAACAAAILATSDVYAQTHKLLPPFGFGGWLENDDAVLLYDKFDVWMVKPDGHLNVA